jgi:GTP cyclohydrolase II/3,4-dihydroxy 2-butanone 4-phosphate synthase/GTP cyclohydrolase II
MHLISTKGGIIIYLFQEGRGIGLGAKMKAYFLQTMALLDTFEANRALVYTFAAIAYDSLLGSS